MKARFRAVGSVPRPSDSLLTPYAQLRVSSVTCASASRSYSPPSSGWPTGSLRPKHHSMRSAIQCKPESCLRVPVPGLRSFLAPHPDRSHQGSPITARRTTGAQTATLRLVMEPALKGQVPRRGFASRPSVSLLTPYGPRRFKGPVGSPLFAPLPANKASCLILVISISL